MWDTVYMADLGSAFHAPHGTLPRIASCPLFLLLIYSTVQYILLFSHGDGASTSEQLPA
jgi:hypothetical protein